MNTSDLISIVSLGIVGLSVSLTKWNLIHQLRTSRVNQTGCLHKVWWSREFMETRQEAFLLSRDLAAGGSRIGAIAEYYHSPFTQAEPKDGRRSIS